MIYIISGVPGSGKSTTAEHLVKQFKKGFLIETDELRLCVKSGYASPTDWTSETTAQFELAAYNSCSIAKNAERYGFTVVIDDAVIVEQERIYTENLPDAFKVFLCPSLETILERNRNRNKNVPDALIRNVYKHLEYRKTNFNDWITLDNSNIDLEEVVKKILSL
ncbi:hypothetical protein A3A69_00570 [candidate division WWE3 bacterium RIFCSPLOWO2_01_FULL_37_15]|uniref:Phosphotransferase n=1 Tax=candidate division WWE3 bacterium RIFCSPLOWO2_01_FULL_37_15 TaxID=1802622 RepID=A0A1F4UUV2_UNCKA|nr:MAG: hypothetical protein A3A69_00570 [candidate division WWE3 bacterium RIFCSPLOWO2_01_FULL_37_15]